VAIIPTNYSLWNQANNKNIVVVVTIAGITDIFSNQTSLNTVIRYGDPGLTYGMAGLTYGTNLRRFSTGIKDYLALDQSSMVIQQKIEPEQGKASITTFTIGMIDKDSYFTNLVSPGLVVPEILGRNVNVYLGHLNTSYPDDYIQIFRGYISDITYVGGVYLFQVSDPGLKKNQTIFQSQTTTLTAGINNSTTTIPITSYLGYTPITNTGGGSDSAITTYLLIDNEYISYTSGSISPTAIGPGGTVTRGARGTTAASHNSGASVSFCIQIQDDAMSMALKLMLSGWNGPWVSGVACLSFNNLLDASVGYFSGAVLLPQNVDAVRDYGLVIGDTVTVSGDVNNTKVGTITGFIDAFSQSNRAILTTGSFTTQASTTSTLSFRSQYDSYPVLCGLKMTPQDVDVTQHLYLKNNFLSQAYNAFQFLITGQENGKNFIEQEIYFPIGAYAVTRQGRSSVAYTKPPFGGVPILTLDKTNILNPGAIKPYRSTNKRKFFNVIQFQYDYSDAQVFQTIQNIVDSTSITNVKLTGLLTIPSRGLKTSPLSANTLVSLRSAQLLNLYKNCALQIEVETTYGIASQVEGGDAVILSDDGSLQIPNWTTGTRGLGTQTFTVIGRALDIKQGSGKLTLMTGTGFLPTDRFGSIAPSSLLDVGSTSTQIVIKDSFNSVYPQQEFLKWQSYIGNRLLVHSANYTVQGECVLVGFDSSNKYKLNVTGLGFTPASGYIVDLANYSTSTNAVFEANSKSAHAFLSPTLTVTGGISNTQFTVSSGDAAKVQVGNFIKVHDTSYTGATTSGEVTVRSVVGTTVTVSSSLGFTPSSGHKVDLVGFADKGQGYRWV